MPNPPSNGTGTFDAIQIGTGQPGLSLADRFADEGLKVAVTESKLFGGTCVNVSGLPPKTHVASARSNSGVIGWMNSLDHGTGFEDHARLGWPNQVRVGDQLLQAEKIFINVGSSRAKGSKVMGNFRNQGWIRSSHKRIDLLEVEVLSNSVQTG